MATQDRPLVVGIFENGADAEKTVEELRDMGFTDEQIGFATRGEDGTETGSVVEHENRGGTREGLVMGAITGGAFGSIVGAAVAVLLPGIGPVIAGGILGAALTGAAAGAVTGGLVGALREWGLPEEEARYYQGEFEAGRTIVTVKAEDQVRRDAAAAIIRSNNGYDAANRPGGPAVTGDTVSTTRTVTEADSVPAGYPAAEPDARQVSGAAVFVPEHDQVMDSQVQTRVNEWVANEPTAQDQGVVESEPATHTETEPTTTYGTEPANTTYTETEQDRPA